MWQTIGAVFIAVIGSNGLWTYLQYRASRNDTNRDRLKTIETSIKTLSDKVDENNAVLARTHILRFSDEIQNGIEHSREYFRQQLDDIDTYDEYCKGHPGFQNSYAVLASKHIKETYEKLLERGEFKL